MIIKNIKARRNGILLAFYKYDDVLLSKDVFNKSGLSVETELSQEELDLLIRLSAEVGVKIKALQLLARRSHSVLELKNKLLKRNYDNEIISKILHQLEQNNYLDDRKFAFLFAEEKIERNKQSMNKVKSDLFKRGISKTIISEVTEKYQNNDIILKNIKSLTDKKISFMKQKYSDENILRNKLFEYLFRKGFEIEEIKLVIK